jgi:ParB-like chromosome segregation protein Spo0J
VLKGNGGRLHYRGRRAALARSVPLARSRLEEVQLLDCIVRMLGGAADIKVKQIVENIARTDMTILEEADAFGELVQLSMTEEEIATKLGLTIFRVRWRLQLLNLAPAIRKMVAADQLDRQQALEVARLESHADQARIVKMINRNELSGWKAVRNAGRRHHYWRNAS